MITIAPILLSMVAVTRVCTIGDSIVEATYASAAGEPWPELLCDQLAGGACSEDQVTISSGGTGIIYSGGDFVVHNMGLGGDETEDVSTRWVRDMVRRTRCSVVIVGPIGGTDIASGDTAAVAYANIAPRLDEAYFGFRADVVVVSYTPRCGASGWTQPPTPPCGGEQHPKTAALLAYNALLEAWVATRPGAVFVDVYPLLDLDGNDVIDVSFNSSLDNTHPDADGLLVMADEVACIGFGEGC